MWTRLKCEQNYLFLANWYEWYFVTYFIISLVLKYWFIHFEEGDIEIPSIHWFTQQMASMTRSDSSQSQDLGTASGSPCVCRHPNTSVIFHCFLENLSRELDQKVKQLRHKLIPICVSIVGGSPTCCATMLALHTLSSTSSYFFLKSVVSKALPSLDTVIKSFL